MSDGPYREGSGTPPERERHRLVVAAVRIAALPVVVLAMLAFAVVALAAPVTGAAVYLSGGAGGFDLWMRMVDFAHEMVAKAARLFA